MSMFSSESTVVTLYPTPESLDNKIREYFELCFVEKLDPKLGVYREVCIKTPTYSGLARYLGFNSRAALLAFVNKRDSAFSDTLSAATLRIEEYLEGQLVFSKAPTGIMFSLKNNAGWEDKTKQQLTGADDKPLVFSWDDGAKDVIDVSTVKTVADSKEGALPTPTLQIESTQEVE